MKRFVNLEETIGKQVGKRQPADSLRVMPGETDDARAWAKHVGGIPTERKGVFRFRTHEEADAWLWKQMTNPRKKHS